ncbi:hypothetical protein B0H13DRAFT_2312797 [Mycena leptocephala]|nr:hypothetical protein B0H13DRAFT_2312797 [Mycena leptocephala]
MSHRRLTRVCGKSRFTVFIKGFRSRSFPWSHRYGVVPGGFRHVYFTYCGRRVHWDDTMGALGLGSLSHLHLGLLLPGGAQLDEGQPAASSAIEDDLAFNSDSGSQGSAVEENTDTEDGDFSGSESEAESESERDSDVSVVISNMELAESLPTKTVAENAKRKPTSTDTTKEQRPKKKRKKNTAVSSQAGSNSDNNATVGPSQQPNAAGPSQQPNTEARPSQKPAPAPEAKPKKKINQIHLFYEEVICDANGNAEKGAHYYQCYLGAREIVMITKGSNHNTTKAQEPWNQDHFEGLVAKWVATCDQPFIAVNKPEFHEMLQYVHHHSPKPLQIPGDDAVKLRIEQMNEDLVAGLKKVFQLLEAIGALTKEEKRAAKSKSRASAYQDSATESLSRATDGNIEDIAETSDGETFEPTSMIGCTVFKLRKIIRHFRSSPQRRQQWEAEAKNSGANKALMLTLDVKTRWSSTHQMLSSS